jgi:alpha-tubulin suppressor-like RCC1 family protein
MKPRMAILVSALLALVLSATSIASAQTYIWGYEGTPVTEHTTPFALTGLPEEPVSTKAGYHSALALEPNGTLYAQGLAGYGQLGDGKGSNALTEWVKVEFPAGVRIETMGIALTTNYAIDTTGQAWEWGRGAEGVSCGGSEDMGVPEKIGAITDATAVAGYEYHVLWLTKTGKVLACGENGQGQSGQPASVGDVTTPTEVPGIGGAVEVVAGSQWSLVRTQSTVYGFGTNRRGRLCQPRRVEDVFVPTAIPQPASTTQMAAGRNNSLFLDGGSLYGCGGDEEGQIGDGSTTAKFHLTLATELVGDPLTSVATGDGESVGISDGEALTWGGEEHGDLGVGTSAGFSLTPLMAVPAVEVTATALDVLARS